MGGLYGSGESRPWPRFDKLAEWIQFQQLWPVHPSPSPSHQLPSPRWDHALASPELAMSSQCRLEYLPAPFSTDHAALRLSLPAPGPATSAPTPASLGLRRPNIAKLRDPATADSLRSGYRATAPSLETALFIAESHAGAGPLQPSALQDIIDFADDALHRSVMECAFSTLGTYDALAVRSHTDAELARLTKEANGSSTAALRLWKKVQRGKVRRMEVSVQGAVEGLSPAEEAMRHWGAQWDSAGTELELPEELGGGELRMVDVGSPSLAAEFSAMAVMRALRRYPKHKSGGEDGDHAVLLHALAEDGLTEAIEEPKSSFFPSSDPSVAPPPRPPHRFPRQAHSQPLDPRAAAFVPLRPSSVSPPRSAPFLDHLSRLFRLVAATGVTPARWGRALVHLIPKRTSGPATALNSRPIGLLPMFRRLFEAIFVKRLGSDNVWARLHVGQAGFRKGWSCMSALMLNHESAHTRRNIAIFLDFANAFPSLTAALVLRILSARGAPLPVQRLVWALLTTGACAALVVNGQRCDAIKFLRGLTQGSIISPALFNLVIDELLRILNARARATSLRAVFFADDGALNVESVEEGQRLLDETARWATENGLRLNVDKCGVVARKEVNLMVYGRLVPQVGSYKYLGIPRDVGGLDLVAYLDRVNASMRSMFKWLSAIGACWSGLVRLRIFKTVCRSIGEYGLPLVALLAQDEVPLLLAAALRATVKLHEDAVQWITCTGSFTQVGEAMSGLLPPSQRFQLLSASLVHHLRRSNEFNPVQALLVHSSSNASTLLRSAMESKSYNSFLEAKRRRAGEKGKGSAQGRASELSLKAWAAEE
ncbi:hypothetical protein CF319_g8438, partial [Tilletia indica]